MEEGGAASLEDTDTPSIMPHDTSSLMDAMAQLPATNHTVTPNSMEEDGATNHNDTPMEEDDNDLYFEEEEEPNR
jgi:hypothetical protein